MNIFIKSLARLLKTCYEYIQKEKKNTCSYIIPGIKRKQTKMKIAMENSSNKYTIHEAEI